MKVLAVNLEKFSCWTLFDSKDYPIRVKGEGME